MKACDTQRAKSEISKISKEILEKNLDCIVGLRTIYGWLYQAGFSCEDEDYRIISAIVDETEEVVKGKIRVNFSQAFLEERDKLEKEYLEENQFIINQILNKLFNLPIIEDFPS